MQNLFAVNLVLYLFGVLLASWPAASNAITLTANAAGWTGTLTDRCFAESGLVDIEILYDIFPCNRQGAVEIDLSEVVAASTSDAILTIYNGAVGNSEGRFWSIDVHGYEADGVITGNDLNAGDYLFTTVWDRFATGADAFEIDLTDFVNAQLGLGTPFIGINLRATETHLCPTCAAPIFIYFDGSASQNPPTLALTPIPIPAAAWLFGSALGLLAWMRRKPISA